jgi:ABC-type glycerol-3-phosphate transport system permease component
MFVGYNLAKFRFPGKSALYALLIFTQTIPIMGTGAASFKLKYDLNMINNPATIWLSWAMGFDYSAFILFGSFQGISKSYSESAEIDGANEWQIFFKIIFPQVFPVIVALLVSNFVTKWNDYTMSQITLNKYPNLAYGLYTFEKASIYGNDSIMATYGNGIYYAALVLTALPGVILYATFQNLIIKNMTVGGLKG